MNKYKFEKQININLLDHCYEDCQQCSGLGCTGFKTRELGYIEEKIDLALKLRYQSVVFPVNAFLHPDTLLFTEKVLIAGLKPVMRVLLRKFNNQTLSFVRKVLAAGGAVEILIDQPVSKIAWVYIQPLINGKNDIRFTLILLKSVNHWELIKEIPTDICGQLEIYSPTNNDGNLYLPNDLLFKVLKELQANKSFKFQGHRSLDMFNQETPDSFFDLNIAIVTKNPAKMDFVKRSIVVPAHNNPNNLEALMSSLSKQNLLDTEVIIVNDGCNSDIINLFEKWTYPNSTLINFKRKFIETDELKFHRAGFARNVGAIYSRSENLIFVDGDVVLPEGFLKEAESDLETHDVVMFRKYKEGIPRFWKALYNAKNKLWSQFENYWQYFNTTCVAVKKSLFFQAGGFNLCFSGYGGEDSFLGYKLHLFSDKWKLSKLSVNHPVRTDSRASHAKRFKRSSQMVYRLSLNEKFYQSHFVLMGDFLFLRKLAYYLNKFIVTRILVQLLTTLFALVFTPYKATSRYFYIAAANVWKLKIPVFLYQQNAWKAKKPVYWMQLNYWRTFQPLHFLKKNIWKIKLPFIWVKKNYWKIAIPFFWLMENGWKIILVLHWIKNNYWKVFLLFHWIKNNFWKVRLPLIWTANALIINPFHWLRMNYWKVTIPINWIRLNAWKVVLPFYWIKLNAWKVVLPIHWIKNNFWKVRLPLIWAANTFVLFPVHWLRMNYWKVIIPINWIRLNAWKVKLPIYTLHSFILNSIGNSKAILSQWWKIQLPFHWVKMNWWRIKQPYHILKTAISNLYVRTLKVIDVFYGIKFWIKGNSWRIKNVYYTIQPNLWLFHSPIAWSRTKAPILYSTLFKYPVKLFYFVRFQFLKRILKKSILE